MQDIRHYIITRRRCCLFVYLFEEKNAFVVIWAKKKKRKKRYPCGQILQRKEFSWFQLMISLLDRNSSVEQINNRAHILEKEICG